MRQKIVVSANTAWNLVNFRSGLLMALVQHGYEVIGIAPNDYYSEIIQEMGIRFVDIPMQRTGLRPDRDLLLLWHYFLFLKRERPHVYLGFTAKPNIYGSIACSLLGIKVINNISGLGAVFVNETVLTKLVCSMYRAALFKSHKIYFQNEDDRCLFVKKRIVNIAKTARLPGSGVNLNYFVPVPLPNKSSIRFLFVARLLKDKGVGEFVAAARILKKSGFKAEYCILGALDPLNPTAVTSDVLNDWVKEGVVLYLGVSDDVRDEISNSDCVVLPSYREGVPRSLLEALAMARPIITTNCPGCNEIVDDGVNGYLCKSKDAVSLSKQMEKILLMTPEKREAMGKLGREKAEKLFNEDFVISNYIDTIRNALIV